MEDSKPVSTPIEPGFIQQKYKGQATKEDILWYQQAIGSLLYASLLTRPDIAYATGVLSRYTSNPSPEHIKAVKRVFRYLNGTRDYTISYNANIANSLYIKGYTDADYARDKDKYKSTTGFIFNLASGPVSHLAKLQSITAQSTTEAEYIALAIAAKEATYLRALLEELDCFKQFNIPIYTDNNGAIQLAKNPSFHARSKHINVRYHFIRQKLADKTISIHYIPTEEQPADGFTKPLAKVKFNVFLYQIGVH
jgi:phosphopantetheinyl transferase (holo-ACP synthase)